MNILKTRNNVISYTVNKEISSNCYVAVDGGEVVVNAPWYFSRKEIHHKNIRMYDPSQISGHKVPLKIT